MIGSICFNCSKATPFLCAWIDRGDSAGITFSEDKVTNCGRYKPGPLPATRIDSGQALQIAGMVVVQAARDLKDLHKRVSEIRELCGNSSKLADYLKKMKKGKGIPFSGKDDLSTLEFFAGQNRFAADLLDCCEIEELPVELVDKMNDIISYKRHCVQCVDNVNV